MIEVLKRGSFMQSAERVHKEMEDNKVPDVDHDAGSVLPAWNQFAALISSGVHTQKNI